MVEDAAGAQLLAYHPGQGAALSFRQVGDAEQAGVQLVACAQGGDDGDAPGEGGLDQIQFAGHQVDAVHNVVQRLVEEVLPPPRLILLRPDGEAAVRIDVADTVGHGLGLGLAQGGAGGLHLAVQVGQTHRVVVHQREGAHAGAGQGLGAPASHAAQTEHGHVGGSQALHGLGAQKHLCAEKPLVHAVHPFLKTGGRSSAPPACPMMSLTRRGT